jgi:hypothetical protein
MCTQEGPMPAIKVGIREFRKQVARSLESQSAVASTSRGETLGIYVPTSRKSVQTANKAELRAAVTRLAELLSDVDEEEFILAARKTPPFRAGM